MQEYNMYNILNTVPKGDSNISKLNFKFIEALTPEKSKEFQNFENLVQTTSSKTFSPCSTPNEQCNSNINNIIINDKSPNNFKSSLFCQQNLKPFQNKHILVDRLIHSRIDFQQQIALTQAHEFNNHITITNNHEITKNLFKQHILGIPQKPKKYEFVFKNSNLLHYKKDFIEFYEKQDPLQPKNNIDLPMDNDIQNLHLETTRKIEQVPYKVLDAPSLQDDFYLNVLDWSQSNILAVGLSSCTYLWSPQTSKVIKLLDLGIYDYITSIQWNLKTPILAVGTSYGEIQLWDTHKLKLVHLLQGHKTRVGSLSWNNNILSSGSRDKSILSRDIRDPYSFIMKSTTHKQEICGIKWSPDGQQLASGGNDNKVFVWNLGYQMPLHQLKGHKAAVKALTWSTQQNNLLISGGGSADRTLRFWNTQTGNQLQSIDTGSQICNLAFSSNSNEFISTHGYSKNEVNVWTYPQLSKVASLTGHTLRVLYLAISPDQQSIVTGAGDETLRFWNVFPNCNSSGKDDDDSRVIPSIFDLR